MGRQFRLYLLPSDLERTAVMLRNQFGARFLEYASPSSAPVEAHTILRASEAGVAKVDCYLAMPENALVKTRYAENRGEWLIDYDSEIIEFSGCHFDGAVLQTGRLYYQTNFVVGSKFRDKSPAFLRWAEQVFRATKKSLVYSPKLLGYVGEDAMHWRQSGGRFAWHRRADGAYVYAD